MDGKNNLQSPAYRKIWDAFYGPAVKGGAAVFDGYASDLFKTGEIICSTGSTAGVVFFSPVVTYSDNTTEPCELEILPYPVFEGGKKVAIQRGSGMGVIKSAPQKAYAASVFLKWFTQPEQNLRFVSSTGYLPVTNEAFDFLISGGLNTTSDQNVSKLFKVAAQMQKEYEFLIPPLSDNIDELQASYEKELKQTAADSREAYQKLLEQMTPDEAFEAASKGVYENFVQ